MTNKLLAFSLACIDTCSGRRSTALIGPGRNGAADMGADTVMATAIAASARELSWAERCSVLA